MEIILWEFHYIFLKHVWPDSQKIGNLIDKKFSGKWDLMADYLANICYWQRTKLINGPESMGMGASKYY